MEVIHLRRQFRLELWLHFMTWSWSSSTVLQYGHIGDADAQHRKLCYSFRSINQILWRLNQSWHLKKAVVLEVFWSAMINRPCPKSTSSQLISRTVGMLEGVEGSLDDLLEAINEVFEDSTALGVELDIDEGSKFCIEGDGSSFSVKLRIVERSGYGIDDDLRLVAKLGIDKR